MGMPLSKNQGINLLLQKEFDNSIVGRILRWTVGTFRIIVIVVEMLVMGAFLSRFWLDAKNSDLNDLIKVKSAQISSQSGFENEFRRIQTKLNVFSSLSDNQKISEILTKLAAKLPPTVSFTSIAIQEPSVEINGLSVGEADISQFIVNLETDKFWKEISLSQINQAKENPAYVEFTINLKY